MMEDVMCFFLGAVSMGILWFFFWKDQSAHYYERGYLDACEYILERLNESRERERDD